MCGLNGIFAYSASASQPDRNELIVTRDAMTARGPDGQGEFWSADRRIGLGHRRLSIIDLSAHANQPMTAASGRYVTVFNGEIYNYLSLRQDLQGRGYVFTTSSDTEVLLHLYDLKGAAMVHDLRGMFAFAIWDKEARSLFLARDAYGLKPLYTSNDGWTFRFASQVKALLAGGKISRDPEPAGLVGFHLWGSVPEPFTLYRDISSLPAGHTQIVDELGPREPQPYASIARAFADGELRPIPKPLINSHVRAALIESVSLHLVADVEVGLFLSAGVDSGALLGLMRDAGQKNIRAITLAFDEFCGTSEDELPLAVHVAQQYGAEHYIRTVSQAEIQTELPLILEAMDQPSTDGINTWFAAKAAREIGLKVAISGVGGDEIFAGYSSFTQIPRLVNSLRFLSVVPGKGVIGRILAHGLGLTKNFPKSSSLMEYGSCYPGAYALRRGLFLPDELKRHLDIELVSNGLHRLGTADAIRQAMTPIPRSPISRVAVLESCLYMRNQLLRDADWAGMGNSVEIRTPLVDVSLLQALSALTPYFKHEIGKRALAAAPRLPLPRTVVERSKTGFLMPTSGRMAADGSQAGRKGNNSRAWAKQVLADPGFRTTQKTQNGHA